MKKNKTISKIQFSWEGKEEAVLEHLAPVKKTYDIPNEIQGNELHCVDNLDFLKLNQERLGGKVKCIYIDPPYNTGKDFIYKDKRHSKGECRHSKWLSFMYPRLKLARNLLREDGVIFVSIDDNEQANLKKLMDEVFGEENFVGDLIRKTKSTTNDAKVGFNIQHENTLIFAKNKSEMLLIGEEKTWENYKNPDNDPNGAWVSDNPSATTGSYFEIVNPYTGKIDLPPENCQWRFSGETFKKYVESGKVKFKKEHKENERGFIFKRYRNEVKSNFHLVNSLNFASNKFMNQVATKERNKLLGNCNFAYPKPIDFMKNIIKSSTQPNDLILDFFAGSGTTGQAVMELNHEDEGNRRFILVQLPEAIKEDKQAHKFCVENGLEPVISSITMERLRRAGAKYKGDVGFKVLKTKI